MRCGCRGEVRGEGVGMQGRDQGGLCAKDEMCVDVWGVCEWVWMCGVCVSGCGCVGRVCLDS